MKIPVSKNSLFEFPSLPRNLLLDIQKAAKKADITNVAIVGGLVRDQLLINAEESSLYNSKDLDLLVEGSATQLAIALRNELDPKRISNLRVHANYNTVEMKIDGVPIDLATARLERYELPGENPKVTPCILEKDLFRRDFTINAMAIELSAMKLIDPHDGESALAKRELHFLHSKSVEDDPSRIIRAARYSARLLFHLAPDSLNQVKSTLKRWPWHWRQGNSTHLAPPALATRLRQELELLLFQEPWEKALSNLQSWEGLLLLDRGLQSDQDWKRRLRWASKLKVNLLTALLVGAENPKALAERLQLPKQQQDLIIQSLQIQKSFLELNGSKEYLSWSPSRWSHEIETAKWNQEAVALSICKGGPIWRPLFRWWSRWRLIKSPISAKELINKGWIPGESLGQELQRLRRERLDRNKKSR